MEKERFLVEVTVKGEKDWKAIHMCGSMADAVPVADAVHNLSYLCLLYTSPSPRD